MNSNPLIVVVSSSNTKPKSIIKLITKHNPEESSSGVIIHRWNINTKYYTADVSFVAFPSSYERSEEFNNQVEALIIHMDTNKESGIEDLDQYMVLEKECNPDIKLLVSNYCNEETKISRTKAIEWCIKRGFEFVELYPLTTEPAEQDILTEKFGIHRIIEALHAHTWSNLVLKPQKTKKTEGELKVCQKADQADRKTANSEEKDSVLDDEFMELFSQIGMMRNSLGSLSTHQRRQCAEQMVTAFWKAIGGEEEELLDL
ncbi:alpha- and gamma-adaptin-binding protein p34-like [Cylas formicarius]|uniref:alpha- and gamma-adaptin-binding protein p34-like n=1 Tax=Cylas formicarius TaxID=197179 RepID=UPI002958A108|nr:alpha- and gamma-adaptin-binding protein p34-like [Cylas formicarius]